MCIEHSKISDFQTGRGMCSNFILGKKKKSTVEKPI